MLNTHNLEAQTDKELIDLGHQQIMGVKVAQGSDKRRLFQRFRTPSKLTRELTAGLEEIEAEMVRRKFHLTNESLFL